MCRSQANYCGNFNCSLKYSVRSILDLFQGIGTMFAQSPQIAIARVVLIFLGFLLVYLGVKGTLEPLIMVPMGLGMSAVNAGVLFLGENQIGNLIIDPLLSTTDELMTYMQINFLQPIYNLTFSNGLIACLVFMGIGILCDIGYVLEHPFISMTIALFAELGTVATYPIARAMGLDAGSSAAVSIIGGADGPMVLFASLKLAPELFVPISIVAYLYLSLTYGGYPYLIKLLIPKEMRGKQIPKEKKVSKIRPKEKIVFCNVLPEVDAWSSV